MIEPWPSDIDHLKWIDVAGIQSFSGKRLLDLGCGSGFISEKAINEGAAAAVGIDIVEPQISDDSKWIFLNRNLDKPDWSAGIAERFDYILAFDIIEHLEAPYIFLKQCYGLLANSGTLILTTPNLSSWEKFAAPSNWSGVRDEQHKILFNKYSLEFTLSRAGFSDIELAAPIRKLSFLGPLQPHLGGQIFCQARK